MTDRRVALVNRGQPFEVFVNGAPLPAYPGETLAGALLAAGIGVFRTTFETGAERGQFCGMGVCYDCLVEVDGQPALRACMTPAAPGMAVTIPRLAGERAK